MSSRLYEWGCVAPWALPIFGYHVNLGFCEGVGSFQVATGVVPLLLARATSNDPVFSIR